MNDIVVYDAGQKQRVAGFKPGVSGNPRGRPKSNTALRSLSATERLLAKGVKGVTETVLKLAQEGDVGAARLVLDRVSPPRRGRLTTFLLPPINSQRDVADALHGLLVATSQGKVTPTEAAELSGIVEKLGAALGEVELEERIAKLKRLANMRPVQ